MWISNVTRKELLEVFELQSSNSAFVVSQRGHLSDVFPIRDHVLIWNKDPRIQPELPVIVLLEPNKRNDFLAWTATYLTSVRPFTAYCRVLEERDVLIDSPDDEPSLSTLEEGCLGLIFGEAATGLNSRSDPKQLSPSTCLGTYSFAMARSLSLRILGSDDSVSDNWISLRRVTRQPELSLDLRALESIWAIFLSVSPRGLESFAPRKASHSLRKISPDLVEATWALCNAGKLSYRDWTLLTHSFPHLESAIEDVQGTREERVRSLDKYLVMLDAAANRDPLTAAFIAGYLTSQVNPGSFDHASLLLPHIKSLGSAIIWYGLCAGMSKEAQLTRHLSGLGRRVLRDLLRSESVLERPRCDISIGELEILMRGEANHVTDLRTNIPGFLEVEITPRVNTLVRWPAANGSVQSSNPSYSQQEIRALVTDLTQALLKAENVRQRLSHLLGEPKPYEETYNRKKKR